MRLRSRTVLLIGLATGCVAWTWLYLVIGLWKMLAIAALVGVSSSCMRYMEGK
jgi:hypothetical protein